MVYYKTESTIDSNELLQASLMPLADTFGQPNHLPLSELTTRCQEETARYFKTQTSDGRYCHEIFRRAVVEKDQRAWGVIVEHYTPLVLHWLKRGNRLAKVDESPDALINETFVKFWNAMSPEKFARFPELKSLLRYLELCAGSVMLDWLRRSRRENADIDPDYPAGNRSPDGGGSADGGIFWSELLELIYQRLKNNDEKLVFQAMFVWGMKPSEICEEWPGRFPSVKRINQIRQNFIDRLSRDEALDIYYRGDL